MEMGMRLGMIGLGKMGLPLARQMMADGHEVCGYDIDPERMKMFKEAGGHPVASAKEMAARSEITFSILLAPEHIEENTIGPRHFDQLGDGYTHMTPAMKFEYPLYKNNLKVGKMIGMEVPE